MASESENSARTWKPRVFDEPHSASRGIDFRIAPDVIQRDRSPVATETIDDRIRPDESLEQIADRNPEGVAALFKSMLAEGSDDSLERAALLAVSLGAQLAGKIFRYCQDDQVRSVAAHAWQMKSIPASRRKEIVEHARQQMILGDVETRGGDEFVRGFLGAARGARRSTFLADLKGTRGSTFQRINDIDADQLLSYVRKQHPQTVAVILSHIEEHQASALLFGLSAEAQCDVAKRVASLGRIAPEVMQALEDDLSVEIDALTARSSAPAGGPRVLAKMLNLSGRVTEKRCLESLDDADAELAEQVRLQMFTFDDIANLPDDDLRIVLSEISAADLAVALKGGTPEIVRRFDEILDEAEGEAYRSEAVRLGKVRIGEVEEAQIRIVRTVRQLEEAGKVTIIRGDREPLL